jgi:hypothetical protein
MPCRRFAFETDHANDFHNRADTDPNVWQR